MDRCDSSLQQGNLNYDNNKYQLDHNNNLPGQTFVESLARFRRNSRNGCSINSDVQRILQF